MASWVIDLGNTHTRVARWDSAEGEPRLVELPEICRRSGGDEPLEAARLVPSATHVLAGGDWAMRVGRWPLVRSLWFLGCEALIGRQALEQNAAVVHPNFVPTFKPYLDREALRTLARCGKVRFTAREVARRFVRELVAEIHRVTGERLRDVVLTVPVEAYETYRAELQRIAGRVGIRRVSFIDEPVAAALGYGLNVAKERLILVVDFGGGTFHLALVGLEPGGSARGIARVLAKEGRAVGGNHVNRWVLAEVSRRAGFDLEEEEREDDEFSFWSRLMLAEACRAKEAVFFNPSTTFLLAPPPRRQGGALAGAGKMMRIEFTREDLVTILRVRGIYRMVEDCLDRLRHPTGGSSFNEKDVEEVLMVGGSTLLPEIYPAFERTFGRDKVRAWQPFEAVAYGACAYGAEGARQSDFIAHDYAFITYDPKTHDAQYNIIVPRGTRFPTAPDLWKRQLVPTCSLGEPETLFKLVICEIGQQREDLRKFIWDQAGGLHQVGGGGEHGSQQLIVPLNESSPTLGYLAPPHSPRDRHPRLEVAFGINADRWLCATVYDLKRKTYLMKNASVVRLL